MGMITIDLNPLPYRMALNIIEWCAKNDVDRVNALKLTERLTIPAHEWTDDTWTLDIPEEYVIWMILKWS